MFFNKYWYDFGARYYDPVIGRFTGVDPIAAAFADLSPFNYASNNPSTMIDLWGLQAADPKDDEPVAMKGTIKEVTCIGTNPYRFSLNPHFWGVPYGSSDMDPENQEAIWNAIYEEISQESTAAGQTADEQARQEILDKRRDEYQKRLDESLKGISYGGGSSYTLMEVQLILHLGSGSHTKMKPTFWD